MSEQMYLKCVHGDDYGTSSYKTGGIYKVFDVDSCGHYQIESGNGNKFYVPLKGSLWHFEVIEEVAPDQPKLTPRSLRCFQEVADVIGESVAGVELQRVIDSKDTVWDETGGSLIECFTWETSPQGDDFWYRIYNGYVPEGYQTNHHQISTSGDNSSDNGKPKSTPEFGDVLHWAGEPVVYIRHIYKLAHLVCDADGDHVEVRLEELDEYAPDPTQELRNRILERWKRMSLDNALDTEVCIAEMRVSDLVDFVVRNIKQESEE